MGQCKCYETRQEPIMATSYLRTYGVCLGTKEIDRCNCGGDESKCNFYPEKRRAALKGLTTAEMWLKAQVDGKTYIVAQQTLGYSKERGLFSIDYLTPINRLSVFKEWSIDDFFNLKWTEMQEEIMTKAEAEEKYGIRIVN